MLIILFKQEDYLAKNAIHSSVGGTQIIADRVEEREVSIMARSQNKVREKWIDVAKFLAIIAVMLDHSKGALYENPSIAYISYFSVSLFILVMGITTMWSYAKNSGNLRQKVKARCWGILRSYIVATIIYSVFTKKSFDLENIVYYLVHFNMAGPFYYVLLYIQLILISPILFRFFQKTDTKKRGFIFEVLAFIGVLFVAYWTTGYSNILGVYGGGGKLFGGTYLIILYIGMWFGKYYKRICLSKIDSCVLAVAACVLTVAWLKFIIADKCQIDAKLPYGDGLNPSSISFGLYSILIAATLLFSGKLLTNYPNSILMKLMNVAAFFGKHTLYIFLYHQFFMKVAKLLYALDWIGIVLDNIWIKRIVYFVFMIGGSLLLEYILENTHKKLANIYAK